MKRIATSLAISAALLASCSNPLMKAVEAIKADVLSPRIVVSQADGSALASGGSVDCGEAVYGGSTDITLAIRNEGKSALAIDSAAMKLSMGNGTEAGSFAVVASPDASIAAGASSTVTLRFAPATTGTKKATLTIPTNDTQVPSFALALEGTGSSIVMTMSADAITTTTATIKGSIMLANGLTCTAAGICWSDTAEPTTANSTKNCTTGTFSGIMMTGLLSGTIYYIRPFITIDNDTTYGSQLSFITLPAAPVAPAASVITGPEGSGKLKVEWSAVTGASIYELYYYSSDSLPANQSPITTTDTTYTVGGLANFSTWYFWIKARNASGVGAASPSGSGAPGVRLTGISCDPTTATIAINATRQISAAVAPTSASDPTVTWTSSAASVATVSSSGLVKAVGAGTATITATSSATAEGNISKTATCVVSVPPAAPVLSSAVTAEGGQVVLTWTAMTGATSYNVYYSLSSGAGTLGTKLAGISGTSCTVTSLTNWSKYYFVVTAVGTGGESTASNQLDCMPIRQEIIVVNKGSDSIDFNLFNATAGSVTRTSGHEYILGPNALATDGAASVAIDPEARNALYVAYTGAVANLGFATYAYSASDGYATSPYADHHYDGVGPEHLVVVTTPSGKKRLYVAYNAQAYIVMYDIDASGNLSNIHTYSNARNDSARYLSADPSGKFLFASNYDASRITSYMIDSATGYLTEVGYVSSGGTNPYRSVVTPDGNYLLVTNCGSQNVVSFAISGTGTLTQCNSVSTSGERPTGIAIDATGTNVYVCSAKVNSGYTNLSPGFLNHLTLSGGLLSIASDYSKTLYGPTDLALDATGTRVIVLNLASGSNGSDGGALVYQVNADGTIVPKTGSITASFGTGTTPNHLIVVKLP